MILNYLERLYILETEKKKNFFHFSLFYNIYLITVEISSRIVRKTLPCVTVANFSVDKLKYGKLLNWSKLTNEDELYELFFTFLPFTVMRLDFQISVMIKKQFLRKINCIFDLNAQ
uniref:Uncharacterized protein n=1 Tax=Heterorhabditis bacteriophora TaxID=37862 RepID=A0A1I7WL51_HETBA